MSVAFSAIPNGNNSLYDEQELYKLLLHYQEKLDEKNDSRIISFSHIINPIDPLLILENFIENNSKKLLSNDPKPLYFYWENKANNIAILGYNTTKKFFIEAQERFCISQKLIEECFQKIIRVGVQDIIGSEPYIFCGFRFFSTADNNSNIFPSSLVFLPKLQIIKIRQKSIFTINFLLQQSTDLEFLLNQIKSSITKITSINNPNESLVKFGVAINSEIQLPMAEYFKKSVASVLHSIQLNKFNKLVLSHPLDIIASQEFSLIDCLKNLREYYPNCYVFALNNGQKHSFVGASPERLISINNKQLVTDALAGSAPRGKSAKEDIYLGQTLLKNSKERREHQLVIDCIIQHLRQLGLCPQISPLKILKLSNIQHLWTPIYAQLSPNIHPLEIVAKLHPTPAVSGFPTDIACTEIRNHEAFERELYAAPLGWINHQGNSEFIVGIRSALISGNQARLYAGAGIVEGSEAEKELGEIKLKFQGLLRALLYSE